MTPSLIPGKDLPDSFTDFQSLKLEGRAPWHRCRACGAHFTPENTHTAAGWRETQITGTCEDCFDQLCSED